MAQVLHVGGVSLPRLASRLACVADCEGLRVTAPVLAALAARAQGDVRAAIQVLSFIKARAKEQVPCSYFLNGLERVEYLRTLFASIMCMLPEYSDVCELISMLLFCKN